MGVQRLALCRPSPSSAPPASPAGPPRAEAGALGSRPHLAFCPGARCTPAPRGLQSALLPAVPPLLPSADTEAAPGHPSRCADCRLPRASSWRRPSLLTANSRYKLVLRLASPLPGGLGGPGLVPDRGRRWCSPPPSWGSEPEPVSGHEAP